MNIERNTKGLIIIVDTNTDPLFWFRIRNFAIYIPYLVWDQDTCQTRGYITFSLLYIIYSFMHCVEEKKFEW